MKKFLTLLLTLCATITLLACFNSDPNSRLHNERQTITGGNGMLLGVLSPAWAERLAWLSGQLGGELEPAAVINASFPLTLNVAFEGFVSDDGSCDTDIVQLAIYYYDKTAGWTCLKNIVNPKYSVVCNDARPLWGRHTFTGSLGYKVGEYIPVVLYFRSRSGAESFNLESFLSKREFRGAPAFAEGASVLALLIKDNAIAY